MNLMYRAFPLSESTPYTSTNYLKEVWCGLLITPDTKGHPLLNTYLKECHSKKMSLKFQTKHTFNSSSSGYFSKHLYHHTKLKTAIHFTYFIWAIIESTLFSNKPGLMNSIFQDTTSYILIYRVFLLYTLKAA